MASISCSLRRQKVRYTQRDLPHIFPVRPPGPGSSPRSGHPGLLPSQGAAVLLRLRRLSQRGGHAFFSVFEYVVVFARDILVILFVPVSGCPGQVLATCFAMRSCTVRSARPHFVHLSAFFTLCACFHYSSNRRKGGSRACGARRAHGQGIDLVWVRGAG